MSADSKHSLMAAYPAHANTLSPADRGNSVAYRDYNLYGTYPRKSCHAHSNGNATLINGNLNASMAMRGILRNKTEYTPVRNNISAILDDPYESHEVETADDRASTTSNKCYNLDSCQSANVAVTVYVRPAFAEFISVLITVFTVTLAETVLQDHKVEPLTRIAVIVVFESACFMIFAQTFADCRVSLNPVVTLGSLFAGGTKPMVCLLQWLMQVVAATLGCFLLEVVTIQRFAQHPALITNETDVWLTSMYRLVLCQMITTAMVVLSYLMTYVDGLPEHSGRGAYYGNSMATAAAVGVTSFASLLSSTVSWNPARTLGYCIANTVRTYSGNIWTEHYIFWLGPIIGSLFASFFYRLLFAEDERRLSSCRRTST